MRDLCKKFGTDNMNCFLSSLVSLEYFDAFYLRIMRYYFDIFVIFSSFRYQPVGAKKM